MDHISIMHEGLSYPKAYLTSDSSYSPCTAEVSGSSPSSRLIKGQSQKTWPPQQTCQFYAAFCVHGPQQVYRAETMACAIMVP